MLKFKNMLALIMLGGAFNAAAQAACISNSSATSTDALNSFNTGDCIINSGTITSANQPALSSEGGASTITNTGNIASQSYGIYSSGSGSSINSSGSITTNGTAIYSRGSAASIVASGTIATSGASASGIFSSGSDSTISNSAGITTTGSFARALYVSGANSVINNTGNLSTTGSSATGIYGYFTNPNASIVNRGNITTSGASAGAIYSRYTGIVNYGNLTTSGSDSNGLTSHGVDVSLINYGVITTSEIRSGGMAASERITFTNAGTIITTGSYSQGIWTNGLGVVTNTGIIRTSGLGAHAIAGGGSSAGMIYNNSGTIWASGAGSRGIESSGASIINNYGTIKATGADSSEGNAAAIVVWGAQAINFYPGSIIVGAITTGNGATQLNFNLGPGLSYAYAVNTAYPTSSAWTATDADHRPQAVTATSVAAASMGAQDTAGEMLYQRTAGMNLSLDRRLRTYASKEKNIQPNWLEVSYSYTDRRADGANASTLGFSNHRYGLTAGLTFQNEITPLEWVFNAENSNLNIDGSNQKIDSSSFMLGVLAPRIIDVLGAQLSAKALVGYGSHQADRKVMTNNTLYDGSQVIKGDHHSYYGLLGVGLTKIYAISDLWTSDVIVGLDLNSQRIGSYREADYFAWNQRTLTQWQSRIQMGTEYKAWDSGSIFARVGAEHRNLIGGVTQTYTINDVPVSYTTTNQNSTYFITQIGAKAQLEKNIELYAVACRWQGSHSTKSTLGNIGLRAYF